MSVLAEIRYVNPESLPAGPDSQGLYGIIGSGSSRRGSTVKRHVTMHDARSLPDELKPTLDRNGFEVVHFGTKINDYHDKAEVRKVLFPAVKARLSEVFGTPYVCILGYNNRSEDPAFESKQSGRSVFTHSYSAFAHLDSGPNSHTAGRKTMCEVFGFTEEETATDRFDIVMVNFWKPWSHSVQQNPFGVLDAETLDFEKESVLFGFDNGANAPIDNPNTQLRENERHRWIFWKNQTVEEALLFKQIDTRPGERARYAFHTSFYDPGLAKDALPRRSIELFCILGFPRGGAPGGTTAKL